MVLRPHVLRPPVRALCGARPQFPDILYGKTVGSGHFCQLEVPEQINAMIDRFLTLMLPR
jgi:pimeloyl-ACP methyl ester carboxylesterase